MKHVLQLVLVAVVSTSLCAADGPNQPPQRDDQRQADAPNDNLKPGQENLTYRQRMVTGKVNEIKEIDVTADNKNENHLLAKVTTVNNNVVIVDLGPRASLKNEVKAGDEIAAFGITGRLNERPLIVASKIATITPIEGREEIYESIPVNYDRNAQNNQNAGTSNERFAQDALQRSNANDNRLNENRSNANRSNTYVGGSQPSGPPPFLRECPDR